MIMKKYMFLLMINFVCIFAYAQTYSITSEGVDKNGNYVVRIVVSTKKVSKSVEDLIKQYAVHGVMFKGVTAANDYSGQPPLVKDPNMEQTKKAWFDAFWKEGAYRRYASVTPMSLSVVKNKVTNTVETSALVVVSSNSLKAYLEEEGIIMGLSNLW